MPHDVLFSSEIDSVILTDHAINESIFGNFRFRRIIFRKKKSKVLRQWSHEKAGKKALIPN